MLQLGLLDDYSVTPSEVEQSNGYCHIFIVSLNVFIFSLPCPLLPFRSPSIIALFLPSLGRYLSGLGPQFSRLEPVLSSGSQGGGESYKAERWLLHSLQVHMLSGQLRPLLRHQGHTRKYYNGSSTGRC